MGPGWVPWVVALPVHLIRLDSSLTQGRDCPVLPEVTVYLDRPPMLCHLSVLLCSVTGFYPGDIRTKWSWNGQEEKGVVSTGLIRSEDWNSQTTAMLEMTPELGKVYTCLVDHVSLLSPVSVEWRVQSEYSQREMLSRVAAFLLGLVFVLVVAIHLRAGKGNVSPGRTLPPVLWFPHFPLSLISKV
ncbi:LOW QUALITY PROTEIN: HLA class II histocompatibility antigen, DO beta chain-like [Glossophaga mutica]